jgi:ribosomal protein S18 acetylase RimI-like enzyme
VIRPFEPTDRAALIALWQECGLVVPWNDPDRDIDRKLAVDRAGLLVAIDDGHDQLVGSVMAGYDGHRGWVNYLAVVPTHQRRGLGRSLMDAAEDHLLGRGCPKINLQIRSTNPDVVVFYESLGFTHDPMLSMGKRLIVDD